MNDFRLPIGKWAEAAIDALIEIAQPFFTFLRTIFLSVFDAVAWVLQTPPFWAVLLVLAALAFFLRGWKFAVGTIIGFSFIIGVGQWENAMDTFALVLVASAVAVAISVPLGIYAARNDTASRIIRPILDFLQTMPAFVYLIPALMLFRVGVVPGIVATVIFALAPGVRLTELGIRGVDGEVVEAGSAFGATSGRILRQIQLPLALPSIMAGINQVIMLALSMVVIAGMVGAGGLGGDIVRSLTSLNVGLGVEAGLSVVILAIVLDRMTASLGQKAGTPNRRTPAPVTASV